MKIPEITSTRTWSPDSVRMTCIKNDLYTMGDNDEYAAMLDRVDQFPNPSDYGLYVVAKDIAEHSKGQTVTNVMYILANSAIWYTYKLDGRDDI